MSVEDTNDFSIGQNDLFGQGGGLSFDHDSRDSSSGGFNIMDLMGLIPGIGLAKNAGSILDWLSTQNWGDGVAGRGSSNAEVDQPGPGGGTPLNEDDVLRLIDGRSKPPEEQIQTPEPRKPVTEGSRKVAGGSMRRAYMPAYRGTGRNARRPIVDGGGFSDFGPGGNSINDMPRTGGGEPYEDFGPGGNSINNSSGRMPTIDGVDSMMKSPALGFGMTRSPPALGIGGMLPGLLKNVEPMLQQRSGGLNDYLARLVTRGDIAPDQASIGAEVDPIMARGRSTVRDAALNAGRTSMAKYGKLGLSQPDLMSIINDDVQAGVPQNVLDTTGLGANIGARQGAQNVNVRGRMPMQMSRRF